MLANRRQGGFALFDVLMALFLFSLGFAAVYGLRESTYAETRTAIMQTEAVNLAQTQLESLLAHSWSENLRLKRVIPGEVLENTNGFYNLQTEAAWTAVPGLLKVKVRIDWPEGVKRRNYELEGLYYVESGE